MKLYKVEATYDQLNDEPGLSFTFFVLGEDSFDASNKISNAIAQSPEDMNNWYLLEDPEEIASNNFEGSSIIIK